MDIVTSNSINQTIIILLILIIKLRKTIFIYILKFCYVLYTQLNS